MLKFVILLFLFLASCAHKPMLQPGSCYTVKLQGTDAKGRPAMWLQMHELANFKVVNIFVQREVPYYGIQMLADDWSKDVYDLVPMYPRTSSIGYAPVDEFDRYISPNAVKFSPAAEKTVKCNTVTDKDIKKAEKEKTFPLMRLGKEPK